MTGQAGFYMQACKCRVPCCVQITERAVRTAAAALAASNNDDAWTATAGDALDDAACASNRARAAQLLSSAASAASSLLQRLAARGTELNSGAVMAAVLKAHGLCTNAPECLAGLMGRCKGPVAGTLVQARQKLAAALKCWVDNDTWTPELIPAVFAAGHHVPPEGPLITALVRPAHDKLDTPMCRLMLDVDVISNSAGLHYRMPGLSTNLFSPRLCSRTNKAATHPWRPFHIRLHGLPCACARMQLLHEPGGTMCRHPVTCCPR